MATLFTPEYRILSIALFYVTFLEVVEVNSLRDTLQRRKAVELNNIKYIVKNCVDVMVFSVLPQNSMKFAHLYQRKKNKKS